MRSRIFSSGLVASAHAINFTEAFTVNPLTNGWQIFGDANLFDWNATNHNLAVTWDSSQSNSYFYHPLGVTLGTNSDFAFSAASRTECIET